MPAKLESIVLDHGLMVITTDCNSIVICSNEPNNFLEATTTCFLGEKEFDYDAFGAPMDAATDWLMGPGRVVVSKEIYEAPIKNAGNAVWFAAVDKGSSRLLAHGPLGVPVVAVEPGDSFALPSIYIGLLATGAVIANPPLTVFNKSFAIEAQGQSNQTNSTGQV